jgi:hypothetical protein
MKEKQYDAKTKVNTLYVLNKLKSEIKKSKLSFLYKDLIRKIDSYFKAVLFYGLKQGEEESLMNSITTEILNEVEKAEKPERRVTFYEMKSQIKGLIKEIK